MSVDVAPASPAEGLTPPRRRRRATPRILLAASGVLLLFSVVRVISGVDELTSPGMIAAALGAAVPIGMAGLGGLWAERAGVVNIGLEGMMILGTWGAGWAGYQWGPWVGLLVGVAMGAIGGLVHALATVTFGVDHIVSGVAINILALGATQYLAAIAFTGVPGGGESQSPRVDGSAGSVTVPVISDAANAIADKGWFFVSDLAGVVAGLTTNVSWLTILAVLLFVATFYILWRTRLGLRLRSCGESPYSAESLGVNVYKYKYIAVTMSGAMAGFGGAFLVIVAASIYREGQTGGRGYIGLAAMIFGNWRPGGLAAGAGLFGYTDAMQLRSATAVHALLLVAAIAALIFGIWSIYRRTFVSGAVATLMGLSAALWYFSTDELSNQVAVATPYVATLLVMAFASQRLRMPAADGLRYRRGEGG